MINLRIIKSGGIIYCRMFVFVGKFVELRLAYAIKH
jgi:hypothetical protein